MQRMGYSGTTETKEATNGSLPLIRTILWKKEYSVDKGWRLSFQYVCVRDECCFPTVCHLYVSTSCLFLLFVVIVCVSKNLNNIYIAADSSYLLISFRLNLVFDTVIFRLIFVSFHLYQLLWFILSIANKTFLQHIFLYVRESVYI